MTTSFYTDKTKLLSVFSNASHLLLFGTFGASFFPYPEIARTNPELPLPTFSFLSQRHAVLSLGVLKSVLITWKPGSLSFFILVDYLIFETVRADGGLEWSMGRPQTPDSESPRQGCQPQLCI